jgi:hypothetical protein
MTPKKNANNLTLSDFVYMIFDNKEDYVTKEIQCIEREDNVILVKLRNGYWVRFFSDKLINTSHTIYVDGINYYLNLSDAINKSIERHEAKIKSFNCQTQKHIEQIEKLKSKIINL